MPKWVKRRRKELGRIKREYGAWKERKEKRKGARWQKKKEKMESQIAKLKIEAAKTNELAELEEQRARLKAAKGPSKFRRVVSGAAAVGRGLGAGAGGERISGGYGEPYPRRRVRRVPRRAPAASVAPMPSMGMGDVDMLDISMPNTPGLGVGGGKPRARRTTRRRRRREPSAMDALYY